MLKADNSAVLQTKLTSRVEYKGPFLNDIRDNANNVNNGNLNFPLSFKYGYFGYSNFPLLFKDDNFKSMLSYSFLRCHLRMGQKVLLLFKYDFSETLIF